VFIVVLLAQMNLIFVIILYVALWVDSMASVVILLRQCQTSCTFCIYIFVMEAAIPFCNVCSVVLKSLLM
jgi:hypothetical protein